MSSADSKIGARGFGRVLGGGCRNSDVGGRGTDGSEKRLTTEGTEGTEEEGEGVGGGRRAEAGALRERETETETEKERDGGTRRGRRRHGEHGGRRGSGDDCGGRRGRGKKRRGKAE
jgi:hypothetical protein